MSARAKQLVGAVSAAADCTKAGNPVRAVEVTVAAEVGNTRGKEAEDPKVADTVIAGGCTTKVEDIDKKWGVGELLHTAAQRLVTVPSAAMSLSSLQAMPNGGKRVHRRS